MPSRGGSTVGQRSASPDAPASCANGSARALLRAARTNDARSPLRIRAHVDGTAVSSKRTGADHTEEHAACERLYRNAAERAERRLRASREAQEAEFQANCTFHPSLILVKEGHRERSTSQRARSRSAGAKGVASARGAEAGLGDGSGASLHRATGSSAVQRTPLHSWRQCLAAQAVMLATRERRLAELQRGTGEKSKPSLYPRSPRTKTREHPHTYLEEKGYKGPINGGSKHLLHCVKGKEIPSGTVAGLSSVLPTGPQRGGSAPSASTPPLAGTLLADKPSQQESGSSDASPGSFTTPQRPTPVRSGVQDKRTTDHTSTNAIPEALPHVFGRLFRDSDERASARALIQLMKEHGEDTELCQSKPSRNDVPTSARALYNGQLRPSARQRSPGAPGSKDTATAIALAIGNAAASESTPQHPDVNRPFYADHTVLDALYAEPEALQQRRETRHFLTENDAEAYRHHPCLDARCPVLAEDRARRHSEANSAAAETVRGPRSWFASDAEGKEGIRGARVHFSYPTFAQRQMERDRRRQEELLTALLNEGCGDGRECRFHPALPQATEEMTERNRSYIQVIENAKLAQLLIGAGVNHSGNSLATATAGAATTAPPMSLLDKRTPRARGMWASSSATAGNAALGDRENSAPSAIDSAEGYEALPSVSPPSQQWHGDLYVNTAPEYAVRAAGSPAEQHRSRRGASNDSACVHSTRDTNGRSGAGGVPRTPDMSRFEGALEGDIGALRIAATASSTYLRQLESELQDALKDQLWCA
ncbi:hypothetical protein LPMP_322710 [Leishmania panamensis]|uniref:Uncharacterized protein n=1 Tax=Leishmania panamensis TaxID=5679 RepID=A0A088RZ23_LEIPA|nr:hypothetical protein LPMP_322710 [Leishmania panamensis]AIO01156.1 hypothetical protein LPMP_322710 [Leishmania panamensis]